MSPKNQGAPPTLPDQPSRRLVLASGLALWVSACSTPQNIIGVPTKPALAEADVAARGHRIYIVTTRLESEVAGQLYSGQRGSQLGLAAVDVVIPPSHKTGKVERPKSLPPDPQKHFVITNPSVYENYDSFKRDYDAAFVRLPKGQRNGILWIHGYNTTLTDAVLRLAQFVEDTGYSGVPFLFSWASQSKLTGYVYDINSALIARDRLEEVPRLFAGSKGEALDVIAHSMGNFVTMEAIRGTTNSGLFKSSGKLRNVILASPDIDIDLFEAQLRSIPREERRFFVLTSTDDKALSISRLIARNPRVGQLPADALTKLGVNVIDLSQVEDSSSIHHTKFADAPEIVQLLGERVLAGDSFGGTSSLSLGESIIVGAGGAIMAVDEAG